MKIGCLSGHSLLEHLARLFTTNSALASVPTCRAWRPAKDESLESSPTFSEYVSHSWLSWFPGTHGSFEKLYSHTYLFSKVFFPRLLGLLLIPSVVSRLTLLRPVAVPINTFSKSHLEGYLSPGNALNEEIGSLSTCPWGEPPDSLTSTTVLWG